jgi:lactoylglutathione lyase
VVVGAARASDPDKVILMTEVASLVLFADDASKTAAFYGAIGVDLEEERHHSGPRHFARELGGVHFAIYAAESTGHSPARRAAGSCFAGFYVDSLDAAAQSLRELGASVLGGHEQMPWGCRVVVEDPDGRAVEVNQRGHCPDPDVEPHDPRAGSKFSLDSPTPAQMSS